jgi:hypothetical protein
VRPIHETRAYAWTVVLAFEYQLKDDAEKITGIDEAAFNNLFSGAGRVFAKGKTLRAELAFQNYDAFLDFVVPTEERENYDDKIVDFLYEEKTFFIERTQKFRNPWAVVDEFPTRVNEFKSNVVLLFDSFLVDANGEVGGTPVVKDMFIFESPYRRSDVAGAKYENAFYIFYYYLGTAEQNPEIVIFDRFANQPIWYLLALLGTAAVVGISWAIFAFFRSRKTETTLASDKPAGW